ncbi:MAG: hypothetical protein WCZ18_02790 [Ottowia sp.]
METISLDAAEAITGISSRTLRRRASDGRITSGERDARGRATMALANALSLAQENTGLVFSVEDAQVLLQADAGDAAAQADMGALFYLRRGGQPRRALLAAAGRQPEQCRSDALAGNGLRRGRPARYRARSDVDRARCGARTPDCAAADRRVAGRDAGAGARLSKPCAGCARGSGERLI